MPNLLYTDKTSCCGCGACQFVCPVKAIRLKADEEGFYYPAVDEQRCISCNKCREICPAHQALKPAEVSRYYALRCQDDTLLQQSTSGGAFSLLAQYVLKKGGLACGAVYDKNFQVTHRLDTNIAPMRKSKYVQSSLATCFPEIKEALSQQRTVLFSGTPCQCHAVKTCFPQAPNLLFAALICRGVQSPHFWLDYKAYLEKQGPLSSYCARAKKKLDNAHTVAYTINNRETTTSYMKDPFCRIYAKEISLRPSCYACPYCTPDKPFDFTLGDFWGIEKILPQLADGKGTSLVITGTQRACDIVEQLGPEAQVTQVPRQSILQPALLTPAKQTILRKLFMRDFAQKDSAGRCDIPLLLKKYGA